jgi:ribosomal protein S18 acetylase RimI-like enzyme
VSAVVLAPLADVSRDQALGLAERRGGSRLWPLSLTHGDPQPGWYVDRVLEDAARDDADAVAAVVDGQVEGLAVLRTPAWDAEHFGFGVGRVEHLLGDPAALAPLTSWAVERAAAGDLRMCSCRIAGDDLAAIHALEDAGFRFVEQVLHPWRSTAGWQALPPATRPATPADADALAAIARATFAHDRFHRDHRFARAAADGVYERWVRTWLGAPRPDRFVRVLEHAGSPAAFMLYELERPLGAGGPTTASIVLNGIDPRLKGRGLGGVLYHDAVDLVAGVADSVTSVVAAHNNEALSVYAKLGFRFSGPGHVTLHSWMANQ